jgi:hypothetical protein
MPADHPQPEPQNQFKPWPEQDENGVDLTLIRENLRLTPLERLRKAERLRRSVLRIHRLVGINRRAESA